ncbi:zinc metallopeptidase [Marinomonas flavescens]|uniref:zinc metallopeptidase n=1 Tax=Marinomonas flavescens TaxID=2529379 RepID=UPI0023E831F6|nr:zinc metallopeptidase [Marinomonas flavescens]
MLWIFAILLFLALFCGPHLWVKFTLKRYAQTRNDLPGSGGELAQHLIRRFELNEVSVETTQEGHDHFDIQQHKVRLSPSVFAGQSLTAVAVASHEVGHAIAHERQERIARLRVRYLPKAVFLQRLAGGLLIGWPLLSVVLHIPYLVAIHPLFGGHSCPCRGVIRNTGGVGASGYFTGRMGCQLS